MAKGLKILVEGNTLDNKTIDSLVDIFAKAIDGLQNGDTKEKLQKSKIILQKLKKIEWEQYLRDQKSLSELDTIIKDI